MPFFRYISQIREVGGLEVTYLSTLDRVIYPARRTLDVRFLGRGMQTLVLEGEHPRTDLWL